MRSFALTLVLVLVGCGSQPAEEDYCVPGQVAPCALAGCAAGGVKVCKDDWSGYGACTCAPQSDGGAPGDAPVVTDGALDAAPTDAIAGDRPAQRDVAGSDACSVASCPSPVPTGCGSSESCADGLDNNCNDQVNEGCACVSGAVQPCFLGPPGRRNVGACTDGYQRCSGTGTGTWGACQGGVAPAAESCDGVDNDCNGCTDDLAGCCRVLACPSSRDLADILPYHDFALDGATIFPGPALSWSWTVTGGPCDQLFVQSAGKPSFTLNGVQTSTATTSAVTFRPKLSGNYTVALAVTTAGGEVLTCGFVLHVRGPGLRVELCWDTSGQSDLDLHLHRPGTTTPWFWLPTTDGGVSPTNPDDCYFANCRASSFYPTVVASAPAWGYGADDWTPLAACENTEDSNTWAQAGQCHNPRLDWDNINTPALAENTNVDRPGNGDTYRVMVHYYGAGITPTPTAHPLVNVYCDGRLRATYGAAPDVVPDFNQALPSGQGLMWRVADVTTATDASGTTIGCDVIPLHPPGQTAGYWVTLNDRSY